MRLGAVLGGVAQGYEQAQKQQQELAIQKQQADFEAQQNALITQSQQWSKANAQPGVVTGTDPSTMSESAHDLAKSYGATDAQLAAADAAGAQGYNALLASLHASGAQPPATSAPSSAGLPAAGPVTINPGDPGYAPQPTPDPSTGGLQFTQTQGGAPSLDYTSSVINHESGGNPNAQNPASTAGGLGQFTDGTWSALMAKYRPDLVAGKTPAQVSALKTDPDLNTQMVGNYAKENAPVLAQAGVPVTPVTLAAAHSLGPGGAISVLKADPSAPLSSVLSPAAVQANPQYAKMTAGGFMAQTAQNMGGGSQSSVNVALTPPAPTPAPQPQQGVEAAAAPPTPPSLENYVGNAYDTPVGVRVTTNPTTRSQADALRLQADNELKLGLRAKDGHLIGIDTLTAANTLAAQDQKLTEGQRQLDWQQAQKDLQDAKTPDDLTKILNKSSLVNAHLTLVANDNHTNFAWEARNPQTGTMYVVEQGTFPQVQRDLISLAGDPDKREAFMSSMAKAQSDADLQAAQAYQARKSGAAAATNAQTNQAQVGLAAAKTPAEIGLTQAQTGAANAESAVNTATATRANFDQSVRQQQMQIVEQLGSTTDPAQRQALMTRYSNLNGMVGAKFESTPGPNGMPQTHITYPNGLQTVIDQSNQGVEVPVGQDSRTWSSDPDIKSQAIQYGWHTDQQTGQMQLGFSTNSGLLPNGQRGPVFSTNLNEVKQALHARSPAPRQNAGLPPAAVPPGPQTPGYDQPNHGLGGR